MGKCKICGYERPLNTDGICEECFNRIKQSYTSTQSMYRRPVIYDRFKHTVGVSSIIVSSIVSFLFFIASCGMGLASLNMQTIRSVDGGTTMEAYYNSMGGAVGGLGLLALGLCGLTLLIGISFGSYWIKKSKIPPEVK